MLTKTHLRSLFAAAALASALAGSAAHATELLSNGSFETPAIGGGNYIYPSASYGSWTYAGSALVGATGSNAWYGGSAPAGQDGAQFAALQGTSSLSQTFTMAGTTLDVSWLAGGRPYFGSYNGDQSYEVLLNGVLEGTFSTFSGEAFTAQNLVVHGLTNNTPCTLSFQGLVSADETSFIDQVSASGGVPEPAGWALMIVGFGGVGAALRGKRRSFATA
jgi:hypothetical protein